jgi:twitching motility protein PilT
VGRFRVNAFRTRGADACVMRRVRDTAISLEDMGMPKSVGELALRTRGLVLVTGPTGSGKSTTLAGMVDLINRQRAVHILTLEDPIEVLHQDRVATVTQRELGTDTLDWSGALRAAMRQDPDVILIGELRDTETVHAAITAAETGHLVLASMHTNDTRETVHRLIEFFTADEQQRVRAVLSGSLEGIVCQRLVPRGDGLGRVCVMEIAVSDARFAEAVADPTKTHSVPDILAQGGYSGMQTFDQHLLQLVLDDTIAADTAASAASNPHDLSVMLRRAGWTPDRSIA